MSKPSLKKNVAYSVAYQVLIIILPLVTAPYVTRTLGSHGVGVYSYTQAYANYYYLFAMLGVNNYGNRTIASVRDNEIELRKSFWEIFSLQFILSGIISTIYIIYCYMFVTVDRTIYILQFFYVASAAFDVNWACFGLERFKLTTIRSTIVRLLMAAATFAFVRDDSDLGIYTFILSFGNLIAVIAVMPYVLTHIRFIKPTISGILKHIKPNLVLFWPVVAVSLYNIMDKIMLGSMSSKEEVGFYTYAERITQMPNTLILALDNVIMPRMSNLYAQKDDAAATQLMDNVMMFAMLMASAMSFGLAAVGPVFAPWFYGIDFARCGLFISLLSPIVLFKGWAGALRTQYLIPARKDGIYIASLTSGAIVNIIINILLIPRLEGIGAIIATIAAEFTVCFIQFFMTRGLINIKKYVYEGLCFAVIGTIMYACIRNFAAFGLPLFYTLILQIAVGGLIYILLSILYMTMISKDYDSIKVIISVVGKKN